MKKFDEIIAREIKKAELSALDALREQRQLCGEVFAGVLYHGFKISEAEERFVRRCNRVMMPLDNPTLACLRILNARRWAAKEN